MTTPPNEQTANAPISKPLAASAVLSCRPEAVKPCPIERCPDATLAWLIRSARKMVKSGYADAETRAAIMGELGLENIIKAVRDTYGK